MPGLGDQHKATTATVNPFEETRPHVSEYTAQEIATLSSRLEKQLGPEYISTRPGASGQKVPYLAADKAINLANEVFGFNGWSSCIKEIQLDFVEESQTTGKVSLGLSVIVRVTLRDGTYHEDIGYGHIENCKGKAAAFEKAKKEGTTDGMKRALRNFGNILGNCVYDKDFVAKVSKLKVAPSRWDPENLHRHADYATIKKEPVTHPRENGVQIKKEKVPEKAGAIEPEDEFATDDFDEVDFSVSHELDPTDEPLIKLVPVDTRDSTLPHATTAESRKPNGQPHPPSSDRDQHIRFAKENGSSSAKQPDQRLRGCVSLQQASHQDFKSQKQNTLPPPPHSGAQDTEARAHIRPQGADRDENPPRLGAPSFATPPPATSTTVSGDPPVGFFTARAAETIQSASGTLPQAPSFNPHLESPSIRKTAGVDHSKTKPVARELVGAPPQPVLSPASRPNFGNPQADKARRVGMPGSVASPLANRSSYKPPQMKRPAEGNPVQQSRPALGDVTSTTVNVAPDGGAGGDVKRQKTCDPLLPAPG
ncbi:DNA repair protein rad52 [Xanthoria parietina]